MPPASPFPAPTPFLASASQLPLGNEGKAAHTPHPPLGFILGSALGAGLGFPPAPVCVRGAGKRQG